MAKFPDQYRLLLAELLGSPQELNERTGKMIAAYRGAKTITLDLSDGLLPTCGLRKTFPGTAAAETAFQLRGDDHNRWITRHTKIWDQFADEEGYLPFAYGYRMRYAFVRDQLALTCTALAVNPSDRRIWVSLWDPSHDGLGAKNQVNVPCPVGFSLSITKGELHMAVTLRSSDVFVGLPYDVMNFSMLMGSMLASINAVRFMSNKDAFTLGTLSMTLAHAHLYDTHFEMASIAISKPSVEPCVPIIQATMASVVGDPDSFVEAYKQSSSTFTWPRFNPKPEVAK